MYAPLAGAQSVREVETLPLPIIQPLTDPSLPQKLRARGFPVFGYAGSIYEWSWWLRGMQGFLEDLLLVPALAEAVTRKVAAHTRALAMASAQAGIDVLCFYDDAGMQTGLQLDPRLWRSFIKPRWREVLEAVRARFPGCLFFLHSCGENQRLLPFGNPAQVREEVRRLAALFREDRRAILCPSNRLQPETPWENVLAFAEEARALR